MGIKNSPIVPWHGIREAPVVLIRESETLLAERAVSILTSRMRSFGPDVEVTDIDAADYSAGRLFQVASPSLFGERRLLRVSRVEKCSDEFLADSILYLQDLQPEVVLLLRHAGGNRGKKLLDAIKSSGESGLVVECKEIKKNSDRSSFVEQEFKARNVAIEPKAVQALVGAFVSDLSELASACSQLIRDAGPTGVTLTTVNEYYGGRVETTSFKIADQAIGGHFREAVVLMRHAQATGIEPVLIVSAFALKLRTMALVGGSRASVDVTAKELGLAPWQVRNARSDLQGWDESGLGAAISAVARTDAAVKGLGPQPNHALIQMVRLVSNRGINEEGETGPPREL
mgnify:CR=1 FL=1|tara:strand:- start:253 stop:1284 length:1032 start_codon:yes stop_codon:yes gene_type:complete